MKRRKIGLNPTRTLENNQNMDNSEKIANMVNSSKVQLMGENGKGLIDEDIENLDGGKFYRVDCQGDVYGIEKLDGGQLVFYEAIDQEWQIQSQRHQKSILIKL